MYIYTMSRDLTVLLTVNMIANPVCVSNLTLSYHMWIRFWLCTPPPPYTHNEGRDMTNRSERPKTNDHHTPPLPFQLLNPLCDPCAPLPPPSASALTRCVPLCSLTTPSALTRCVPFSSPTTPQL